mmetsp:Transcript_96419/g.267881  ORF Transcript_96419/g.267881 Transcript_96419/m.267881 type:complete len:589 (+) Transcript_96419:117-1883(+)
MEDDTIFTGVEAIKSVCNEQGVWNWCLIGADPETLPLAGGGSGFIDEMRECLSTSGNSVVAGMIRCTFKQIVGDELTVKWVIFFATLDGQEESMSAVKRGQALGKRPAMEKAFGQYCKVISDNFEITAVDELSTDDIVARLKKTAIIDGELEIPKYDPISVDEIPMSPMVAVEASEVVEEYEPELDADPESKEAAQQQSVSEGDPPSDVPTAAPQWEVWGDGDVYHAYDEAVRAQIDQAHSQGLSTTQVQVAGGWTYEIDFKKMVQRNPKTGKERPLRCVNKALQWEVVGDEVEYHAYDEEVNEQIQQAHSQGLSTIQVKVAGGWTYEIDFKKMIQRNPKTGMERSLRCVAKASSGAEAATCLPIEEPGEPASVCLNKGDLVDIWNHAANKWFTDGLIVEVRDEASTTAGGKPLPAGCAKIFYDSGKRAKWLQPKVLNDRRIVKPFVKPPNFRGYMKKQTHNVVSQWNVCYFELRDGFLTWWKTLEEYDAGVKPHASLGLVGLQMPKGAADKSTRISIRTASSKGVVYNFDINADDADGGLLGLRCLKDRRSEEYATAVQQHVEVFSQHAALADRMHQTWVGGKSVVS